MSLQYVTDDKGQTTGVFIPIQEWENIKSRYKDLAEEEIAVPEWHKEIVRKRMELYQADSSHALDFDTEMAAIEKNL